MKALSIRQPWAWLITHDYKDIENRTWKTNFRGTFLVHAPKKVDREGYRFARAQGIFIPPCPPTGGIVGSAVLVDCVTEHESPWATGPYMFVLEDAKPLDLIRCPGRLGFFEVDYIPATKGESNE